MNKNYEIYVSTDIEADGPIPGPHSMLSLGSAAFSPDGHMLDTYSMNLVTLEGATADPDTTEFWKRNQKAYDETRKDTIYPEVGMKRYVSWLKGLPGKPVFVGYPAGFDFLFVYWYLIRFAGESPFSFSALDIKSYAMCKLNMPYRNTIKRNMPSKWFSKRPHTHVALDDAIEQGELFINMLRDKS